MRYNAFAYVVNHTNLTISKKEGYTKILLTRKTYPFVKLLYRLGCISRFLVTTGVEKAHRQKYLVISALFYKNVPFFKGLRLVSTPTKRHTISLKALRVLNASLFASVIILSTPLGLMPHHEALSYNMGGLVIAVLS